MKGWIKLHILCHTEESSPYEDMNLDISKLNLPYKKHLVQISCIGSISSRRGRMYTTSDGRLL